MFQATIDFFYLYIFLTYIFGWCCAIFSLIWKFGEIYWTGGVGREREGKRERQDGRGLSKGRWRVWCVVGWGEGREG